MMHRVFACPIDEACPWTAEPVWTEASWPEYAQVDPTYRHISVEHPEVIEPDPAKAGRLYRQIVWTRYRKVA